MTPITLSKPSTIVSELARLPADLSNRPLVFEISSAEQRRCTNKNVLANVIDALADKSRCDLCIATIFKNAYLNKYQTELNQIIKNIETQHGVGTVCVNPYVKRLLAEDQIDLLQKDDGTVQLEKIIAVDRDLDRHSLINSTLETILPTDLCNLICAFDDEIEISAKNEETIIDILKSGDQVEKGMIIAAAGHQVAILYLNILLLKLKDQGHTLDFSNVDMSNLDLPAIDLSGIILTNADMHGCYLCCAKMQNTILVGANLNGACLTFAKLNRANLTDASLIEAKLHAAVLNDATLVRALLKYANLTGAHLRGSADLTDACLDYAVLEDTVFNGAVMVNTSLVHANMIGTSLIKANLTNAKMMHVKLNRANLLGVNLTHADLSYAVLDNVELVYGPILTGTIWEGVSASKIVSDEIAREQLPLSVRLHCVGYELSELVSA